MNTVVHISDITKKFNTLTALDRVSFTIPEHSVFGVLGPNGAGKTTLFSVMAGFFKANEGEVVIFGENDPEKLKGRMSILPQDALFQSNIPIIDQLTFFLRLMGRSKREAILEVVKTLELVELSDVMFRESSILSHGMYKRLALAQAFLGNPELIILDEPTSGLDWKSAKQIRELIKKLKLEATIVVSSHNMQEMRELCDHVAILSKGTLVKVGPVDEVTGASYAVDCVTSRNLDEKEIEKIREIGGIEQIDKKGEANYSIAFSPSLSPENIDHALKIFFKLIADAGIILRSFTEKNKLEDEYLRVTEQEKKKTTGGVS
jgi:ABC-type multidrug transport system ATPase subunit